jgi:GalNAc-alpha-(1->4)-GalNAc-alpha-(1->3)-diNAcBac-PP-undecaprenol alpha-1,4-N-acetyl-D-galactosaminyltransferase
MANYWAAAGWDIHLITLAGADVPSFYELKSGVVRHGLDVSGRLGDPVTGAIRMGWRIRRLRAAIERASADAVLSFNDETNVITLLATRKLCVPVIVSERSDPHAQPLNNPWRTLRPWVYRRATCVVAQTQHALDFFSDAIRRRGKVIPNPVVTERAGAGRQLLANRHESGKVLLGMGRLSREKGFDYLIEAFATVAAKHPDWTLEIWGEGNERGHLESMVSALGLGGRVRLPGVTPDPADKMRRADLFVLSSRHEGFPNVLCEAMACGLPVISFDCHSGPAEIIRDGVDGVLCPPACSDALAAAMTRLMSSEAERNRLAAAATHGVQRFSLTTVMRTWTELITDACRQTVTPARTVALTT